MYKREYPLTLSQILMQYQEELEQWISIAHLDDIKKYLLGIHGAVYPDDWEEFVKHHLAHFGDGINYISGCKNCQEIILAINTISQGQRPELKKLFKLD